MRGERESVNRHVPKILQHSGRLPYRHAPIKSGHQ